MLVVDGTSGVTFNDSSLQGAAASPYVLKNRIINGDMRIDQRNAGASVTPSGQVYTVDRWLTYGTQSSKYSFQQNAGSVTTPVGFTNYLGITSLSSYSVISSDSFRIAQRIEGLNISDLAWGTANAKTVTLSFQVYSSLTGTFGGALNNSAFNRTYPFSFTISSANTWTSISVTIPGDTTGTWLTSNGLGIELCFSLGAGSSNSATGGAWGTSGAISPTGAVSVVGTNGATFYITGVQLEVGSTATPFERRMYGQELINCQRYFAKDMPGNNYASFAMGNLYSSTTAQIVYPHKVTMRTQPTVAVNLVTVQAATTTTNNISSVAGAYYGYDSTLIELSVSGFTARDACWLNTGANGSTAYLTLSAEL